jgi:hypothetical protein
VPTVIEIILFVAFLGALWGCLYLATEDIPLPELEEEITLHFPVRQPRVGGNAHQRRSARRQEARAAKIGPA